VTEHLRDQGCLGPLLAWYYRSWIAPSDMDGSKSSGIPWGYLLSYGCLVLYTLVLTLRYWTTMTQLTNGGLAPISCYSDTFDHLCSVLRILRDRLNRSVSGFCCLPSISTMLLSLGYTSRDAITVFFAYVAHTWPYR
jgi:hypothetical protein